MSQPVSRPLRRPVQQTDSKLCTHRAGLGEGGLAMAQFEQSDANPSVAMDKESKMYRILLFADGIPTALGRFSTDRVSVCVRVCVCVYVHLCAYTMYNVCRFNTPDGCIEGYWGYKDRISRGTLPEPQRHGVLGVQNRSIEYVYVCMCVCMYVCTYVCMHACMHACLCVRIYT